MKKQTLYEEVYSKRWEREKDSFTLKDFGDFEVLDTDIIHFHKDEGYYSENNSWDPFTELTVSREREETDEEWSARQIKELRERQQARPIRYENYLKLKEEFENE